MAELKTMKDFGERIIENSGVDIDNLPHGAMFTWFGDPSGKPTVFRQREASPMDPASQVIAIFQNDDVVRIYTIALVPPEPRPSDWKPKAPTRYTFTKTAPTYVAETMGLEVMADEIADEWSELADGISSSQREIDAVIEHVEGLDDVISKAQLLEDLHTGLHHGVDDDDDDIDEPEVSDTIPSAPPAAPATVVGGIVEAPQETPPS